MAKKRSKPPGSIVGRPSCRTVMQGELTVQILMLSVRGVVTPKLKTYRNAMLLVFDDDEDFEKAVRGGQMVIDRICY